MKKQNSKTSKFSVWKCSCGCIIPKKNTVLSGGPQYNLGFHVHCSQCTKIVASFVNPKETQ